MKKRVISVLAIAIFAASLFAGCGSKATKVDVSDVNPKEHSSNIEKYANIMDNLGEGENTCVSPLSFNTVFAYAANGGDENTKATFEDFLGMTIEDYNRWVLSLSGSYKDDKDNEVSLANSIWLNKDGDYKLTEEFKEISDSYYNGETYIEDLYAETAGDKVNKWVDKNTNGMIKKLHEDGPIKMDSLLINTLYFKGTWMEPFEDGQVFDEKFVELSGNEVDMKSMHGEAGDYFENEKASAFSIFYEGGRYEYIGILPKEEGNFKVSDLDVEGLLKTRTQDYKVYFSTPKFTIETTAEGEALKEALAAEGITYEDLIFSNIADKDFVIKEIIQKTKVEVDEKGTKAAAATEIGMMEMCAPAEEIEYKEIYLTRPFVYLIYDNEYDQIMFMGKVVNIPQ